MMSVFTAWHERAWLRALLPVTGFIVLALVLWSEVGLRPIVLIEEWIYYNFLDRGLPPFGATLGVPNRPLLMSVYWLTYQLDPDSFVPLHIAHIVVFVGKGLLLYRILSKFLPGQRELAFVTAILFVVHPAETSHFSLRVTSHHLGVLFYLLAVDFLVAYWQHGRWPRLMAAFAALIVSVATHELIIPVALLTPLALLWFDPRPTKRWLRLSLLWCLVPAAGAVWLAALLVGSTINYQFNMLAREGSDLSGRLADAVFHLVRAYRQHFYHGWEPTLRTGSPDVYWWLGVGVGVIVAGIGLWLARQRGIREFGERLSVRRSALLIVSGLVIIAAGFAPFLPVSYRASNDRVFLVSTIGGALALMTAVYVITSRLPFRRLTFASASGFVITVAVVSGLNLHARIASAAAMGEQVVASVIESVPEIGRVETLVLLDPENWLTEYPNSVVYAIPYLYGSPDVTVINCQVQGEIVSDWQRSCRFERDGIRVTMPNGQTRSYVYDQTVILELVEPGALRLLEMVPALLAEETVGYQPQALFDPTASPPARVWTVLRGWPYRWALEGPVVEEHFHRWLPGTGWTVPWRSVMWMEAPTATLKLRLPADDYTLTFRVERGITREVLDSLAVTLNNIPLELHFEGDFSERRGIYSARIPRAAIEGHEGESVLAFHVSEVLTPQSLGYNDDTQLRGLALDWLRIERWLPARGSPE